MNWSRTGTHCFEFRLCHARPCFGGLLLSMERKNMLRFPSRAKFIALAYAFLAISLLAACSGGDSSGNAASTTPPPVAQTYAVSGSILNAEGATVAMTGSVNVTATVDASGNYSFKNVSPGTYVVSPTSPGYTFAPVNASISVVSANVVVPSFTQQAAQEGLSSADLEKLDSIPDTDVDPSQIVLPNGMTLSTYAASRGIASGAVQPQYEKTQERILDLLPVAQGPEQKKNDVIAKMVLTAQDYACARRSASPCTKWNFSADTSDPVNKPSQIGLTYVWGGKTPGVRTLPADGCPQMTFGMDCSGLIYNLANAVGISVPAGTAATQSVASNWNIPVAWDLKMSVVTDGTIQVGDIVSWGNHIGIAETSGTNATASFISSTGGSGLCLANIKPPKGPRSLKISAMPSSPSTVLRMVTTLSGTFDIYIRCAGESTDASDIKFTINNDNGGPFNSTGSGVDYNGAPLCFNLSGNYEQLSNTLSATLAFCDNTRSDYFSIQLLQDDTGYFPMTKVIDNGGCPAEARLVRNSSSASPSISMNQAIVRKKLNMKSTLLGR